MSVTRMLMLSTALPCLMVPFAAAAQDTAVASSVDEIIVTARKREESSLDVPVIVSAISQERLQRLQLTEIKDLAARIPGLGFTASFGSIGTQVYLRGVGTTSFNAGVDQSVSLNIDGMQMSQGLAFTSGMFDVASVEVLKGPQALFFGKNSPGGIIALRTADPTDELFASLRYGYEAEAINHRAEMVLAGPVSQTLGFRIAALYEDSRGFFKNLAIADPATGSRAPDTVRNPSSESLVIRGTALWEPTEDFTARLKVTHAKDDRLGGIARQYVSCPDGTDPPSPGIGVPFLGGGEDCKLDRVIRMAYMDPAAYPGIQRNGVDFQDITQNYGTLELNYNIHPKIRVTSATAYYKSKNRSSFNAVYTAFAGTPLVSQNRFRRRDFTQEVRIDTSFDSPLNVTIGGFYQDANVQDFSTQIGNIKYGFSGNLGIFENNMAVNTHSLFGQARWQVSPQIELAGGARWTDETRELRPFVLTTGIRQAASVEKSRIASSNISPEFTINYKPLENISLFAAYKRGFKSGSFNLNNLTTPNQRVHFDDERVEGGEIGLKSRLLNRSLSLDIAGYVYKYSDLQVGQSSIPLVGGLPIVRTLNAAAAKVYGIDFDLRYQPPQIENLNLRVAGEWNRARFTKFVGAPCWGGQTIALGCDTVLNTQTGLYTGQDLSGTPLVRAPRWQVTGGFDYEMAVGGNTNFVLSNEYAYSSRYLSALGKGRRDFYQRGFVKVDVAASLKDADDRWEVSVIGKNIGNIIRGSTCSSYNAANAAFFGGQITGGNGGGPAGVDELGCSTEAGRQVWLRLTFRPFN